jgi:PAS domain-containing protein
LQKYVVLFGKITYSIFTASSTFNKPNLSEGDSMGVTPTDVEHEVKSVDIVVSKGDAEGNITYANPIFFKLAGYTQGELLDKPHSVIRHPDMPKIIFK